MNKHFLGSCQNRLTVQHSPYIRFSRIHSLIFPQFDIKNYESILSSYQNFVAPDLFEYGKCRATVFISGAGYHLYVAA